VKNTTINNNKTGHSILVASSYLDRIKFLLLLLPSSFFLVRSDGESSVLYEGCCSLEFLPGTVELFGQDKVSK
jgi:hypothetical protein